MRRKIKNNVIFIAVLSGVLVKLWDSVVYLFNAKRATGDFPEFGLYLGQNFKSIRAVMSWGFVLLALPLIAYTFFKSK
jgi:hypothetical protein